MKPPTRKSLINKLDKLCSEIVRARGFCQRCNKSKDHSDLQCAHIFHRRHFSLRWELDNLLCLCKGCHMFWAHLEPVEFAEFAKQKLGRLKYGSLRQRAQEIKKWTLEELDDLHMELWQHKRSMWANE